MMEETKVPAWETIDRKTSWVFKNIGSETVVSSRVRIARNIWGFPFPHNMSFEQAEETEKKIMRAILSNTVNSEIFLIKLNDISDIEKNFLVERHMISDEMTENSLPCSAVIIPGKKLSVLINEEDHIRIQCLYNGLKLREAAKRADNLDDEMGAELDYAFSPKTGFLTACPTNIGTGIRASVIIHIPALCALKKHKELFKKAETEHIMVRGFYGEGTEPLGCFYQLSSKETTGKSEEEIIENLEIMVNLIEQKEEDAAGRLFSKKSKNEAIVSGIEKSLSKENISSEEFFKLFSGIVLANKLGITGVNENILGKLFYDVLPCQMQIQTGEEMLPETRDEKRGKIIKKRLRRYINV